MVINRRLIKMKLRAKFFCYKISQISMPFLASGLGYLLLCFHNSIIMTEQQHFVKKLYLDQMLMICRE